MSLYRVLRPLVFLQDAEKTHARTITLLKLFRTGRLTSCPKQLASEIAGIHFPSIVGLAAGFDKNGEVIDPLFRLGFGSVEVGTVTPRPQFGNTGKRLFRVEDMEAVVNRFGFNNEGHDALERRLRKRRPEGVLGINLGANKDSDDKISDYVAGVRRFSAFASYLSINVSSPNTPGLRALQEGANLDRLIEQVVRARAEVFGPPILLKISPDLRGNQVKAIADACLSGGIDGIILTNTTTHWPAGVAERVGIREGGLSGKPLAPLSLELLRAFRAEVGNKMPLIAVGGISTAADVYERIRAGARAVQMYTSLAYAGPGLVRKISRELVDLLNRDGFPSIDAAVGADERQTLAPRAPQAEPRRVAAIA